MIFGGDASTVGLLYAAPGVGALIAALTSGWVGTVSRRGRIVVIAVVIWGVAITIFGLISYLPLALLLLAVAGAADVVSAVFRNTILQWWCLTPCVAVSPRSTPQLSVAGPDWVIWRLVLWRP